MNKLNKLMINGMVRAKVAGQQLLERKKEGADEIVLKAGLVAVACAIIVLWKTGVIELVNDWVKRMTEQSSAFWTNGGTPIGGAN